MRIRVMLVLAIAAIMGLYKLVNLFTHERSLIVLAADRALTVTVTPARGGTPQTFEVLPYGSHRAVVGTGRYVVLSTAQGEAEPYKTVAEVGLTDYRVAVPSDPGQCFVMLDFAGCYGGSARDVCNPSLFKKYPDHRSVGLAENVVFDERALPHSVYKRRGEGIKAAVLRAVRCELLKDSESAVVDAALGDDLVAAPLQRAPVDVEQLNKDVDALQVERTPPPPKAAAPGCGEGALLSRLVGCCGPQLARSYADVPGNASLAGPQKVELERLASVTQPSATSEQQRALGIELKAKLIANVAADLERFAAQMKGDKAEQLTALAAAVQAVDPKEDGALDTFFDTRLRRNDLLDLKWRNALGPLVTYVAPLARGTCVYATADRLGTHLGEWNAARPVAAQLALFE